MEGISFDAGRVWPFLLSEGMKQRLLGGFTVTRAKSLLLLFLASLLSITASVSAQTVAGYIVQSGPFANSCFVDANGYTVCDYPGVDDVGNVLQAIVTNSDAESACAFVVEAYTADHTLDPYTQPAVNATVSVRVSDTSSLTVGKGVWIKGGGDYTVTSISDSTHAVLTSIDNPGVNVAPGTPVPAGSIFNRNTGARSNEVVASPCIAPGGTITLAWDPPGGGGQPASPMNLRVTSP
jgi:hypothetical protein